MAETFIAILTAHLLGDFVFQTTWMIARKKHVAVLVLHVVVVTALSLLLLGNFQWQVLLSIFVSHFVFDLLKVKLCRDTAMPFVVDQLAHVAVLVALAARDHRAAAAGWWPSLLDETYLSWFYVLLCGISGLILLVPAGGILIGKLMDPISKEIEASKIILEADSIAKHAANGEDYLVAGLHHGGKYIGWLERFLTMLLMLIGQPAGIGFLIAAKSILRFGEIKESKHRKVAEYIIIGTFLSFGWALLMSVLMQQGVDYWLPKKSPEITPLHVILEPAGTIP